MNYRFLAALAAGLFCAPARADVSIDFENRQIPPGWVAAGGAQASWAVASDQSYAGAYSLRTQPTGSGQTAAIQWTGSFAASTLSFMLRHDRAEACCDDFRLSIDGVAVDVPSGSDRSWIEVRQPLTAGPHTIQWSYRNGPAGGGAWIDNVRLDAALPVQPLMQVPGAVLVSADGALVEVRHDTPATIRREAPYAGALAIAPNGDLYLADSTRMQVLRYQPAAHAFATLAEGVYLAGFEALDDRLIGGQGGDYCGAYSTVSYATGSVFHGAGPIPCGSGWNAAVRHGPDLWVMHEGTLARRSVALPDAELARYALAHSGQALAVDPDGSLWQLSGGYHLFHLARDGSELAHYALPDPYQALEVREDGLLALLGEYRVMFLRPEHGYSLTRETRERYGHDLAFVPGAAPDQDGDGLPLWWEQAFALDPAAAADAAADGDGDGLSNRQEYAYTSNPTLADTDGDGAADGQEYVAGAHPRKIDSDGDGLDDGFEILGLHTDPVAVDTDGDGMGDHYEYTHAIDALVDDRLLDTDGDGLSNFREFELDSLGAAIFTGSFE